jgi:Glyoxalase-like domain
MTVRVGGYAFDCADPVAVAAFWTHALGFEETSRSEVGIMLHDRGGSGRWMWFAMVPEPKTAKNRYHLDLETDELDAEIGRLERLGATTLEQHRLDFWDWNVMADPEGNEFCLGRTRPALEGLV